MYGEGDRLLSGLGHYGVAILLLLHLSSCATCPAVDVEQVHACPDVALVAEAEEPPEEDESCEEQEADSIAPFWKPAGIMDDAIIDIGGRVLRTVLNKGIIRTNGIIELRLNNQSKNRIELRFENQCDYVYFIVRGVNDEDDVVGPSFGPFMTNRVVRPGGQYSIIADIRQGNSKWLDLETGRYQVKVCIGGPHLCLDRWLTIEFEEDNPVAREFRNNSSRCKQLCPDEWPNRCSEYQ